MTRRSLMLIAVAVLALAARAHSGVLDEARAALESGDRLAMTEAASALERAALERGGANADWWLAAAALHAEVGELGRATLAARRAEREAPTRRDIRAALDELRSSLAPTLRPAEMPWRDRAALRIAATPQPVAGVAAGGLWALGWILVIVRVVRRTPGRGVAWAAAATLWALAGIAFIAWHRASAWAEGSDDAVIVRSTPLLAGPSEKRSAPADPPTLPAGVEVRLEVTRGGWSRVSLPGGSAGWVREGAAARVAIGQGSSRSRSSS